MRISDWSSDVCSSDLPVRPNSWEVIFTRACKRCEENGFSLSISPHQLRHTFAVHMLALLIPKRLREAALPAAPVESYRPSLGSPPHQARKRHVEGKRVHVSGDRGGRSIFKKTIY